MTPVRKLRWQIAQLKGYQTAIGKLDVPSPNRLAVNYEIERLRKHLILALKEAENALTN